ncbi:MAG: diguanylate cyclase [Thermotaleaceae bacterium]
MEGEIQKFQIEKRYIHKKGNVVWILLNVSVVKDSSGKPFYGIAQIQDITISKEAQEELRQAKLDADQARAQAEKLAQTDYLTGLYNRGAFMSRLLEKISYLPRTQVYMSIVMVDIDHFKIINDTHGHRVGDMILQQFSTVLKSKCRTYDFVGRYGGEEFILCLPETTAEEAYILAEQMRNETENLAIYLPESNFCTHITASFGIASGKAVEEKCVEKLIEYSDRALYQAKQKGRNRVEIYPSFS